MNRAVLVLELSCEDDEDATAVVGPTMDVIRERLQDRYIAGWITINESADAVIAAAKENL